MTLPAVAAGNAISKNVVLYRPHTCVDGRYATPKQDKEHICECETSLLHASTATNTSMQ